MCEICNGQTPAMVGAVRASNDVLIPYKVDINGKEGLLELKTPTDISYVEIDICPFCGEPVGLGRFQAFINRVKRYFNA